jgi:hypothetical protein
METGKNTELEGIALTSTSMVAEHPRRSGSTASFYFGPSEFDMLDSRFPQMAWFLHIFQRTGWITGFELRMNMTRIMRQDKYE